LNLDPTLFSNEEKESYIRQLFGDMELGFEKALDSAVEEMRRWEMILNARNSDENPYRIGPRRIHELAKKNPPRKSGRRVTDFTDWVFGLYNRHNYKSLALGEAAEREIARRKIPIPDHHDRWRLVHNGIGENARVNARPISSLLIDGEPVFGSPDLVFREKRTGRVLIIEVKATRVQELPSDGWPNLRAQLWAYSQIDDWRDSEEILMVGEIWGVSNLKLRKTIGWVKGEEPFESRNRKLFDCYSAA